MRLMSESVGAPTTGSKMLAAVAKAVEISSKLDMMERAHGSGRRQGGGGFGDCGSEGGSGKGGVGSAAVRAAASGSPKMRKLGTATVRLAARAAAPGTEVTRVAADGGSEYIGVGSVAARAGASESAELFSGRRR